MIDTLKSMRVFLAVAEMGNFAKAADMLNISNAMASKHVAHLEKQIQARLFNRSSRHVSLTEAGEAYFRQCSLALETLDEAQRQTCTPSGWLRITAPVWFACHYFAELTERYRTLFPDVHLDIDLSNRRADLAADGYDLALRLTNQLRGSEIALPLGKIGFQLVGAPRFAEAAGDFAQLTALPAILPSYTDLNAKPLQIDGGSRILNLSPIRRADNTLMLYHWILAGSGIGYLPDWLIDVHIARGELIPLLPPDAFPPVPLYAVHPHRRYINSHSRSLIDFLKTFLAK